MLYVFIISLLFLIWLVYAMLANRKPKQIQSTLTDLQTKFLNEHVPFYKDLSDADKVLFEKAVADFLAQIRVEWIGTEEEDTDRLLVAASAIIPIWGFNQWKYPNISSVILYKGTFNQHFAVDGAERNILGMVGNGYMNGQMILSQQALRAGFEDYTLGKNTGIHEFVHLLDKADGATDGIPENLLQKQYVLPWLDMVHKEIRKINSGKSDISAYGATNESEFLAVTSEYFFEKPKQMKDKHPELYTMLERIFKQHLV